MKQNHFRLFAILIGLLVCAGAGYGVYHFAQVPADGHFVDPAFAPPLADSAGRVVVYVAGEPILKAIEEQRVVLKRKAGDAPVAASEIVASLNERDGVRLAHFPVLMPDGALLHHEAPVRLMLDGEWRPAGYFMPWAARLGLLPRFDAAVVQAALREIDATGAPLGINLSPDSLCDATFRGELFTLLQSHPDAAPKLWIEIPEYGAVRHLGEFRALCVALRPLGCKLGIEHAGSRFSHLSALHELGLDYIKIDAAMIRDIDKNPGNQAFLRGLCTVAHSIGVVAIAEGVGSNEEMSVLPGLGLDAMTGPAMSQSAAERSEISESPNPAPAIE
jgi:EAL domain-containing protein (putative c-di-GMP-specific phosphodiesterase class I)